MNDNNPLVRWIARRVLEKNKNCIIIINGPTGSGKTYAAIDLALTLAKRTNAKFTLDNNMDFKFSEILKKTQIIENDKPGATFLFEEVGVIGGGAASREWQSKANAFFNSFMQTARHRNQIFIMTCPLFTFLEKGTRSLVHLQITMDGINKNKCESYGKAFIVQTNVVTGKVYMKYLRFKEGGAKRKLKRVVFNLPPADVVDNYEKSKRKYTDELNKNILESGKPKERPTVFKSKMDVDKFKHYKSQGLKQYEIANIFKVTPRTIRNWEENLKLGNNA